VRAVGTCIFKVLGHPRLVSAPPPDPRPRGATERLRP
jgi:hypothetical protein